jgi:hypothetical protein
MRNTAGTGGRDALLEVAVSKPAASSAKLFGMIALSMGMITKRQLDECLDIQEESGKGRQLGEIMLGRGDLTESQVRDILAVQKKMGSVADLPPTKTRARALIGEIMVEAAYIDAKILKSALEHQELLRKTGISPRLGELLISLGKLTRSQLEKALAIQAIFPNEEKGHGKV